MGDSSSFFFGLGKGHLPESANEIARKYGAELVNYTDPGCLCGYGCGNGCPRNRRHWFEAHNRGDYENGKVEQRVLDALYADGVHVLDLVEEES